MTDDVGSALPFEVSVSQNVLDKISVRLALSEIGYAPDTADAWHYGTSAAYLAEFLEYWRESYDWRATERELNRFPQFKARVEDIDVHFYHVRGSGPEGRVILLTHGWPGSVMEFLGVIERLAHPERFGGEACEGFDLVIPSLPGYGFSSRPRAPIGPRRTAQLWRRLMIDVLGYSRFYAQGGDWGAAITHWLGSDHPDVTVAIHLNLLLGTPPDDSPEMCEWRERLNEVRALESGYAHEQATRPQTIGLALHDSPLGFAAWVLEKFQRWGDTRGDIESRFSKDLLIGNIMIYLVNEAVISSLWMYTGADTEMPRYTSRVEVPVGVALFPGEFLPIPPRAAVERALNLQRWSPMPSGGHFAAMEEPALFADEVRSFFKAIAS
ncbi:epoxide hydrolase [Novosphingobium sp. G106]|uniref:epoxide hydrolase family protein n=1 Tax=Novosphingobium sp. G106 TaxID=2849500 RepID=UPI001C2DA2A2|nr:epoxide hydrolase family protein [Novosphingobium sp. G106]MBV1688899.1 epoxide hydrolase [Novosphingobium sp. G106]